jgi:hypothetical protein
MCRINDLKGRVFGRLTVVNQDGVSKNRKAVWRCKCECGMYKNIIAGDLVSGRTLSCGCLHKDRAKESSTIHGRRYEELYPTWNGMMDRCHNKNSTAYKHYGARGITVCDRWHELDNFLSDVGDRPEGTTLDRKDNNKGYYPENCRWATNRQQSTNRSNNVYITYEGVTKTKVEWAEEKGMHIGTLKYRLMIGWSVEDALNKATRPHKRKNAKALTTGVK